ncbi:uncharacterized protein LOC143300432 isoform X2 [Babylonia areolata]
MYRGAARATTVATCDNTQCVSQGNATDVKAVRNNAETSVLTVNLSTHRDHNVRLECFSRHRLSCTVRSVYYSRPTHCKFHVSTGDMQVSGSCYIPKIYASDGNYVCQWSRHIHDKHQSVMNGTFSLTPFVDLTTSRTYQNGTCSFSSSLFLLEGVFNFSLLSHPGSEVYIATVTVGEDSNVTISGANFVNISQSESDKDLQSFPCQSNKIIDVEEGAVVGLVCDISNNLWYRHRQLTWTVYNPRAVQVATCNTSHCTMLGKQSSTAAAVDRQMLAIRPNSTQSVLYVNTGAYSSSLTKFACAWSYRSHYCRIRSVYASSPTNCRFDFDTDAVNVTGQCDIPKMYTSDGTYKCQWIEQYQEQTERTIDGTFDLTSFTDNGRTFKKGTCSFTTPLFELNGMFTYRIDPQPGHQEYIASVDVVVAGGTSSLTISGSGHVDSHITHNVTDMQVYTCSGNTQEVSFGARIGLVCPSTSMDVRWSVSYRRYEQVATCNATQCTMQKGTFSSHVLVTRQNDTTSALYVSMAAFEDQDFRVTCNTRSRYTCTLRAVYVSPPSNCQLHINADNMTVWGNCYFAKIYSPNKYYTCNFIYQSRNETRTLSSLSLPTTSFYDPDMRKTFQKGLCSFSSTFFFIPGAFNLSLSISTGSQVHLADVKIDKDLNISLSAADYVNASFQGSPAELKFLPCNYQTYTVSLQSMVALVCTTTGTSYSSVVWKKRTSSYYWGYSTLASCYSGKCTHSSKAVFVTQPNTTTSVLYVNLQQFSSNKVDFRCLAGTSSTTCHILSVFSSPPSDCQINIDANNMTVSGSCVANKMLASDSSYLCSWIQIFNNQTETKIQGDITRSSYKTPGSLKMFYKATCSFSVPLFIVANSSMAFSVDFDPGEQFLVASVSVDEHLNMTVEESEGVNVTVIPGVPEATTVVQCSENPVTVDVPEDSMAQIICPDTFESLRWVYKFNKWGYDSSVANCDSTSCTQDHYRKDMLATRPSSSESALFVHVSELRENVIDFICTSTSPHRWNSKSQTCRLRTVYSSPPTNCRFEVDGNTMTVSGSCDVKKVFSSDRVINCTWIQRFENQTTKFINGSFPLTSDRRDPYNPFHPAPLIWPPIHYRDNRGYKNGTCSFSTPLLLVAGVFHFAIHVNPGSPTHVATLHLDGPSDMKLAAAKDVKTTITGTPLEMNVFHCQNGTTIDIPEYTQAGLICEDPAETPTGYLKWAIYPKALQFPLSPPSSNISCNTTGCEVPMSAEDVMATRPNVSTSVLYLNMLTKRDSNQRVECRTPSLTFCLTRVVYSSPPTNCQFDFNSTTYTITSSCEVDQMFSSDGQYTCQWIQQVKSQTNKLPATDFTTKSFRDRINRLPYKSARCSLSFQLLMVTAETFTYSIQLSPGSTVYLATLVLDTHATPEVKLTGAKGVNTTINGIPTKKLVVTTSTTTTTTMAPIPPTPPHVIASTERHHQTSTKLTTTVVAESSQAQTLTYVGIGVGGSIGFIVLIAVVLIGFFVLRKLSGQAREREESEGDEYFYTPHLKSDSMEDAGSTVAIVGPSDSRHSSSSL